MHLISLSSDWFGQIERTEELRQIESPVSVKGEMYKQTANWIKEDYAIGQLVLSTMVL